MTIRFCPECGGILIPHKEKENIIVKCKNCNYVDNFSKKDLITHEHITKKQPTGEGVAKNKNIFATYKNVCKKCGYDKAQILDLGVFVSDEDNLILLKCGKCGFSERIGRRTS